MSARTKAANTLGPSSLTSRKTAGPLRPGGFGATPVWLLDAPLSSMAGLTTSGGTWDTSSGYLNMVSPTTRVTYQVIHSYPLSTAFDKHVVQVDVRIPAGFTGTTDAHLGVGFTTSSFSSGSMFLAARGYVGGTTISWLKQAVAWVSGPSHTFTSGQWYTIRSMWDVPSNTWTSYVDGTLKGTTTLAQSETGMFPALSLYRDGGSPTNFSFRNLKYWGGLSVDTAPT